MWQEHADKAVRAPEKIHCLEYGEPLSSKKLLAAPGRALMMARV
jgi:hypothetical protein